MWPYIVVFMIVWLAAFEEYVFKSRKLYPISAITFLLFCALRFETGYDWPQYKEIFYSLPEIYNSSLLELLTLSFLYGKEPLYIIYTSLLKSLTNEFQILIFLSSLFQVAVFTLFLRRVTTYRATVFAATVTWVVFTLYFSVIRQAMAVSFFMLFLLAYHDKKHIKAIAYGLAAMMFHYSAILYFIFFAFALSNPSKRTLAVLIGIGAVLAVGGQAAPSVFELVGNLIPIEFITNKLAWYVEQDAPSNILEKAYSVIFATVMGAILLNVKNANLLGIRKIVYVFAMLLIVFQLAFLDFPLMRNRVQYISLPFVYIFFFEYFESKRILIRSIVITSLFSVTFLYFILFLSKDSSLPFVPYQGYIHYVLTDDKGDGLKRVESVVMDRFGK